MEVIHQDAAGLHFWGSNVHERHLHNEEGVMRPGQALNCAIHAVKTKEPLEQRIVFIHIGV
jgi:hypothetical protein